MAPPIAMPRQLAPASGERRERLERDVLPRRVGQQDTRAAVTHDVAGLTAGEMEVDRREAQARADARGPHLHELGTVAAHQGHTVAGLQRAGAERIGEAVRGGVELGERPVTMFGHDRDRFGLPAGPEGDRHSAPDRRVEIVEQVAFPDVRCPRRIRDLRHGSDCIDARPDGPPLPCSPVPNPLALLQLARPKQWVKNLLVFAAPGAAGVLTHGTRS